MEKYSAISENNTKGFIAEIESQSNSKCGFICLCTVVKKTWFEVNNEISKTSCIKGKENGR